MTSTLFDHLSAEHRLADAYRRLRSLKPLRPLIGHGHPITSQAVAEALAGSDRMKYRLERLLHAVYRAGDAGVIDDELIVRFSEWPHSSVTAAMSWLRQHDLVIAGPDSRATRYGNQALVNRLG